MNKIKKEEERLTLKTNILCHNMDKTLNKFFKHFTLKKKENKQNLVLKSKNFNKINQEKEESQRKINKSAPKYLRSFKPFYEK